MINPELDRKRKAKIIIEKKLEGLDMNRGRTDVQGYDTLNRRIYKRATKVFRGECGGY